MTEGAGPKRRDGHGVLRGKFLGRGCFAREGAVFCWLGGAGRVCHYNKQGKRRELEQAAGGAGAGGAPSRPLRHLGPGLGPAVGSVAPPVGTEAFCSFAQELRGNVPGNVAGAADRPGLKGSAAFPPKPLPLQDSCPPRVVVRGKEREHLLGRSLGQLEVWAPRSARTVLRGDSAWRGWDCLLFLPALLRRKHESFAPWKFDSGISLLPRISKMPLIFSLGLWGNDKPLRSLVRVALLGSFPSIYHWGECVSVFERSDFKTKPENKGNQRQAEVTG